MAPRNAAAEPSATEGGSTWRELAVARSLDPARVRAEKRVQRFLDAAVDLMQRSPDKEFTVQEVVEQSGQSLRSFYQYFAGKHELLLALFEESVRTTAERLRELIADEKSPEDRLHRFATEYYLICRPSSKPRVTKDRPTPAMAEFAQQLLTSHPDEASRAFVPIVSLLTELLDDAAEAGAIRPGLQHTRIAGVVLQAIMFNAFATTISGAAGRQSGQAAAEALWDVVFHGIGAGHRS
jgi:AcrR family transcriptional regulator